MSEEINVKTAKFQKLCDALIGKPVLDTVVQDVSKRCCTQMSYDNNKTYLELEIIPSSNNRWELPCWNVYMDKDLYRRPKVFQFLEFAICKDAATPNGKWIEIVLPQIGETTLNKI